MLDINENQKTQEFFVGTSKKWFSSEESPDAQVIIHILSGQNNKFNQPCSRKCED